MEFYDYSYSCSSHSELRRYNRSGAAYRISPIRNNYGNIDSIKPFNLKVFAQNLHQSRFDNSEPKTTGNISASSIRAINNIAILYEAERRANTRSVVSTGLLYARSTFSRSFLFSTNRHSEVYISMVTFSSRCESNDD